MRVLFVCLGNICRSPTAEGVFRRKVEEAGLASVSMSIPPAPPAGMSARHLTSAPAWPRKGAATICRHCVDARSASRISPAMT